ncbi:MFS transporter [Paenibacillus protaetiae]|uniref:MFS transporter n=2 Tax=Paenibacillus protaetiae TaxID=2509456 RepID=A0A4P6F5R6_9BACL|nr:MFS transporter [Paenibacillus protaetiae]
MPAAAATEQPLWRHSGFLILLATGGILAFGSKIYELALPLILYSLTHSSVNMAAMRGIEFLPNLLFAMFIGVIVDRVRKKIWSLWMTALQAAVLCALYACIAGGHPPMPALYAGGFLLMLFGYAANNARVGMVKHALPEELLLPANASFNFVSTLAGIAGPVLTGLLLMLPRMEDALVITAGLLTLSFVLLLFLRSEEQNPSRRRQDGFWRELKEGWIELWSNRVLWQMTIAVLFLNAASGMADTTVVFYAKDSLQLNNASLGIAMAAAGAGGLLGSLLVSRLRSRFRVGMLVTVSALLVAASYGLMAFSRSGFMLGCSLFINGLFEMISNVSIWTFRQESTPHRLIGRISGITGSLFKLAMPLAIYGAGWISQLAEPSLVFIAAAAINTLVFAGCRFSALWRAAR